MVIEESRVFDNEEICNNPSVIKNESYIKSQPSIIFNGPGHVRMYSNIVYPVNNSNMMVNGTTDRTFNNERVIPDIQNPLTTFMDEGNGFMKPELKECDLVINIENKMNTSNDIIPSTN